VIRTRVEPLAKDIQVLIDESLSPKARSAALAGFARGELSKAQEINRQVLGRIPSHETWVDGRKGAALESVRPNHGRIIFEFDLTEDIFDWIHIQLVGHSPIGPEAGGHYFEDHKFYADGREYDPLGVIPTATEYVMINIRPYARRLERRYGIYQAVAKLANSRVGKALRVRFTYRAPLGVPGVDRQPAIVITSR
jgi:hypothetical protein